MMADLAPEAAGERDEVRGPGAVSMMLIATVITSFAGSSGRSAWFVGAFAPSVSMTFVTALYFLPPR